MVAPLQPVGQHRRGGAATSGKSLSTAALVRIRPTRRQVGLAAAGAAAVDVFARVVRAPD
jgi:hypothetical protein